MTTGTVNSETVDKTVATFTSRLPDAYIYWGPNTQSLEVMTPEEAGEIPEDWRTVCAPDVGNNPTEVRKTILGFMAAIYLDLLLQEPGN